MRENFLSRFDIYRIDLKLDVPKSFVAKLKNRRFPAGECRIAIRFFALAHLYPKCSAILLRLLFDKAVYPIHLAISSRLSGN